jgi:UDP-N-acetylmuramate dehydrogenase
MKDKIFRKLKEELPEIQEGVLLKEYTTYKIGGPARYFFTAKTKEKLMAALKAAKNLKLPVFILGGGSNLLISDKGFKGLVIKINIKDINLRQNEVQVGAGADLTKLSYVLADAGLSGLEWATGIPGATVGGAIYGHAQAFGIKMSDVVKSVEAINLKTFELKNFLKKQCRFSLKNSIFKKSKKFVIVSAVLEFEKKDPYEIKNLIKEFMEYRKNGHPMNFPSAGSTFVNPEAKIKDKRLLIKFPELNEYNRRGTTPSGYLISKCGLAGKKIGNAQISEKHANFIINLGGADAKCVLGLIRLAKRKVKKTFGINLETEVQFVGF